MRGIIDYCIHRPQNRSVQPRRTANMSMLNKDIQTTDSRHEQTHTGRRSLSWVSAGPAEHGQRVDNFLIRHLKGVPKTRIYKAVRSGEVRVNGSRIKVSHRLAAGDRVRIPPLRMSPDKDRIAVPPGLLERIPVLFEDEHLMVVDKPSGLAVHGGSGLPFGLIEAVRQLRPGLPFIELAHRLDRETSGCLMLAKSRRALLAIQSQFSAERPAEKIYLALVEGDWRATDQRIDLPLLRMAAGDMKKTRVDPNGQRAASVISTVSRYAEGTLVRLELETGRMHQARVHCAAAGHPVAGDRTYGNRDFNRAMRKPGLGRLFLHAHALSIVHPDSGRPVSFDAPLPEQLSSVLERLHTREHT